MTAQRRPLPGARTHDTHCRVSAATTHTALLPLQVQASSGLAHTGLWHTDTTQEQHTRGRGHTPLNAASALGLG